ncbi:DUF4862 family protein [Cryobacterium sp. PAMC25264]|uniref:DUF4862 family protein n=1 Tax=Cryobacterium sp. PAMC25264 TaxID=2861288 RepID=UPI001C6323A9|nr:DUF4862 family protein [Cryobacterium sp. PAMC25264]QYF74526.1 DUF4862 family protein [Cryobacterium sp. PAMC25264]
MGPAVESSYLGGLAEIAGIRGLELPWLGSLHPHDEPGLLAALPARWQVVLTSVGYTVAAVARDPRHGLASEDAEGRRAAVANVAAMLAGARRLNDSAGNAVVIAIELQAGPGPHPTSSAGADALAASLAEIGAWEWEGAAVLLEHCDARVPGQSHAKGFLPLGDEIAAIRMSGVDAGVVVNWGRSAIELRSSSRVLEHVQAARDAGVLRGLMFSGVADRPSAYGEAWADAHLPFSPYPGAADPAAYTEPASLLTVPLAHSALTEAGGLLYSGIKFAWRPADASVGGRVEMIRRSVGLLTAAPAS